MRGISAMRMGSMRSLAFLAAALAIGAGLGGCSTIDNALFGPGEEETAADEAQAQPSGLPGTLPESGGGGAFAPYTSSTSPASSEPSSQLSITPVAIEPGSDTGTVVGKTVAGLRGELSTTEGKIVSAAQQLADLRNAAAGYATSYHESKAHITTRLQIGTTRGNPELVSEWNAAQSALDSLTANINSLNALGTEITDSSSRTHYLLNTIQATFNVSGAVDEDHRQLTVLEDETNQTIVLIDRLLKEVSENIQRQTAYVANERASLTTLASSIKAGELYGSDLGSAMLAAPASYGPAGGTPLVTIRFDRPNVDYQQILFTALSQALQSRPGAAFDVVAVSPTRGTAAAVQLAQTSAQRHAQEVLRSMTDMGVPGTRLNISSSTNPAATAAEVRVYVR